MVSAIPEDQTQVQMAHNIMLDKLFIITLYAIPTVALLIICFFVSRKK